nr:SRPBCC family protein [Mycobacterium sp. M26]
MRRSVDRVGIDRYIDAPAAAVWQILVDLDTWPQWGPSVASAALDDGTRQLSAGATGRVRTAVGVELPFRITEFEPGRHWAWAVAGVGATTHTVTEDGDGCRVSFGAPWWATPYLAVCGIALARIERLARPR